MLEDLSARLRRQGRFRGDDPVARNYHRARLAAVLRVTISNERGVSP